MNDVYFSAFSLANPAKLGQFVQITHKISSVFATLACAIILYSPQNSAASNYFYEFEISKILQQQLPTEQVVWLKTESKQDTLALLKKSETAMALGGLIIIPDLDHHPDWPEVIHDIRHYFPRYGWATLAVQPPLGVDISNKPTFDDVYNTVKLRINAAIKYLNTNSAKQIILLGRGNSANFAIRYAAETQNQTESKLDAIIFISAFDDAYMETSDYIKSISLPMLDVFAEKDDDLVLSSSQARIIAARFAARLKNQPQHLPSSAKVQELALNKTGNLCYRQMIIPGSDARFITQTNSLNKTIRGWLSTHFRENMLHDGQ